MTKLPHERVIASRLINTRIAELKEAFYQTKSQYKAVRLLNHLFSIGTPESSDDIEHQILVFTKLANVVKDPEIAINTVYLALAEALNDRKSNTKENQVLANKVMHAFSVTYADLGKVLMESEKRILL